MRYYRVYFWLWKRIAQQHLGRGSYNDNSSAQAIVLISALQIANVFYLIEEVLFTDARGCGACDSQGRLYAFGGAMAGIYLLNIVVFWPTPPDTFTPLPRAMKWQWVTATLLYVAASLYLVL